MDTFLVPPDRDRAIIGRHRYRRRASTKLEAVLPDESMLPPAISPFYWDNNKKKKAKTTNDNNPRLYGYPIHARCWTLIEQVIGPGVAERHLELFLQTLKQQFRKRINPARSWAQDAWFGRYPERYVAMTAKIRYLYRDPVRIPAVRDLLNTAVQRKPKPKPKPQSNGSRRIKRRREDDDDDEAITRQYTTRRISRFSSALGRSPFGPAIDLPMDVQCLILDQLDRHDFAMLHEAFSGPAAEWRMPDSYWRSSAPDPRLRNPGVACCQ